MQLLLNRDAAIKEEIDADSEIEMSDPEKGPDKNSNPLLQHSRSSTLTSNPLWALSSKTDDGENDAEKPPPIAEEA